LKKDCFFDKVELLINKSKRMNSSEGDSGRNSIESIERRIHEQVSIIREWAAEMGLAEGKDYQIFENVAAAQPEEREEDIAEHEKTRFYLAINEEHYKVFKDFFLGKYSDKLKERDADEEVSFIFSWGGRVLVDHSKDSAPIDTVAVKSCDPIEANSYHSEFRKFFKERTGKELPTASELNTVLKDMSGKGLELYQRALSRMEEMHKHGKLPDDAYGVKFSLDLVIKILEDAKTGEAVEELLEVITKMPPKMRHFADLTYNLDDIPDYGRLKEIVGIEIPSELRIDLLFERLIDFDRMRMNDLNREFGEYLDSQRSS